MPSHQLPCLHHTSCSTSQWDTLSHVFLTCPWLTGSGVGWRDPSGRPSRGHLPVSAAVLLADDRRDRSGAHCRRLKLCGSGCASSRFPRYGRPAAVRPMGSAPGHGGCRLSSAGCGPSWPATLPRCPAGPRGHRGGYGITQLPAFTPGCFSLCRQVQKSAVLPGLLLLQIRQTFFFFLRRKALHAQEHKRFLHLSLSHPDRLPQTPRLRFNAGSAHRRDNIPPSPPRSSSDPACRH